jgi:hypothetical protein
MGDPFNFYLEEQRRMDEGRPKPFLTAAAANGRAVLAVVERYRPLPAQRHLHG